MSLNPKAREWFPNAGASSFVPGVGFVADPAPVVPVQQQQQQQQFQQQQFQQQQQQQFYQQQQQQQHFHHQQQQVPVQQQQQQHVPVQNPPQTKAAVLTLGSEPPKKQENAAVKAITKKAETLDLSQSLPATTPAAATPAAAAAQQGNKSQKKAEPKKEEQAKKEEPAKKEPKKEQKKEEQGKKETKKEEQQTKKEEPKKEEQKKEEPKKKAEAKKPEQKKQEESKAEEEGEEEEFEEAETDAKLRRHVNLVFIGHVDAGKSTLCGHIMLLTGNVDSRTIEKFEHEAKANGRESWKYAWAMDITDNERLKGKTEECGIAVFNTENKRFTILDAPGHRNFVPHMIGGASQADVAILVISARKGEFEAGFDKNGQTREHVMLAKTVGVRQLVVVVTKMDDPFVEWKSERYDEVVSKLGPYLKQVGYGPNEVKWIPISGYQGFNIRERVPKATCPWYDGPSLLEYLDEMKPPERLMGRPVRLPIIGKYKNRGTMAMGKLESGTLKIGDKLVVMPNKQPVVVDKIYLESSSLDIAEPGDNIRVQLSGIEEEEISLGFVLCSPDSLVPIVKKFQASVNILEYKSIICAGYSCVMHIHSVVQEVTIDELIAVVDKKTKKVTQKSPKFVKPGQTVTATFIIENAVCLEAYKDFQQLGRFMLRDEGKTVAVGIVTELLVTE